MKVIRNIFEVTVPDENVILTIGSFDGVHLGHQEIIRQVVEISRQEKGVAGVMVLRPHPRQYFFPDIPINILTCETKQEQIFQQLGVDMVLVLPFDFITANLEPDEFVRRLARQIPHLKHIVIGHDFRFGRGAKGDYKLLKRFGELFRFSVDQVPPLIIHGERVSSSLIRELILEGEVEKVVHFLGRQYSIVGKVERGKGMGKILGFPTANVNPYHNTIPAHGVYAGVCVLEDGRKYISAINVGIAPTIRNKDLTIEAHLIDFNEDILGQEVELIFYKHMRPEKKFSSRSELVEAIREDVEYVKHFFFTKSKGVDSII